MLTNNWWKMLAATLTGATITNGLKDCTGNIRNASYSGVNGVADLSLYYGGNQVITNGDPSSWSGGLTFGDSDTAPTKDDYKLAGTAFSNIAGTVNRVAGFDDDGAYLNVTATITNNNSSAITIKEVCLWGIMHYGTSSNNNARACMDRSVLDSPVTIAAGGIGQVTYTIRMDYPTE